jgi:serine/threonine protein kinase
MMDKHWKQITPSDFAWENEALEYVKSLLPDHDPYRAWANFEFIANDGSINEVDLLLLTSKGMFFIEIKSHPGTIGGDAANWEWKRPEGGRTVVFDNPRLLARRKVQKLISLLKDQPSLKRSKESLPFIEALVFLSAENLVITLEGNARQGVVSRSEIVPVVTQTDEHWRHAPISAYAAKVISRVIDEAGIKESARSRRVGSYELQKLLDESDLYQDWLSFNSDLGIERKIRMYLTRGKTAEEVKRLDKAAKAEFRMLEGIEHSGILRAKDYQYHDSGPALIYEYDSQAFRLDRLLLSLGKSRRLDTLNAANLLRQIAEAVQYAHGQKLYHRALSPKCIWVKAADDGSFSIKIGNWATAERNFETESRHISALTNITRLIQDEAGPYTALEAHSGEGDGVSLDVYSLGAIAYHLFTGLKPAESDIELLDKLRGGNGLQITDVVNGASETSQYLVQYATHPDVSHRLESVDEFLRILTELENELSEPSLGRLVDPTDARKGDVLPGNIQVEQLLGKGACSIAYLVNLNGSQRVLKVAITPEHNNRLMKEGDVLSKLRHQAIVGYHQTLELSGHTALLIDYAEEGTLAQRLRRYGPAQLELLERFGEDLLGAVAMLEDQTILHRDIKPENIGVTKQGSSLHLVLFDFSLSGTSPENITAGTQAYMDPFIREPGRRRWDDQAERFSAALTLYEMASGSLPGWALVDGLPAQIDGELEIDRTVFDPSIRDNMLQFFRKALARNVDQRFASAGEMLREWRFAFHQPKSVSQHPTLHPAEKTCPVSEAQLDTQIGLLALSPQALDTLSRRNINTVAELVRLNRSQVRVWMGVGVKTRTELSDVIGQLQARLQVDQQQQVIDSSDSAVVSVDRLFQQIMPKSVKATDPSKVRFLNEYLGRLDGEAPKGIEHAHWPTPVAISGYLGLETAVVREIQDKVLIQWGKTKAVTSLRDEIVSLLEDNGGVMTAVELAHVILHRRGSVQESPLRERWSYAVVRAAVETELSKQEPRWLLRRSGNNFLIADDRNRQGEELADYACALGELADECARQNPLLSPARSQERVRAVPAPESFAGLSNHRLLRLAAAASQHAALSSRVEFYPRGMSSKMALELAQAALLGSRSLTVEEIQSRVAGRYPEAEPLPGRPVLDEMIRELDLGFEWRTDHQVGEKVVSAFCLPTAGQTSNVSLSSTRFSTQQITDEELVVGNDLEHLNHQIQQALSDAHFSALTVQASHWLIAQEKLCREYPFERMSFDDLLLNSIRRVCSEMPKAPDWNVVLRADAADKGSRDWQNLMRLVHRALPGVTEEILKVAAPVLLTDPGLIARYELVGTWLTELRQKLLERNQAPHGLVLLIAADAQHNAAMIDKTLVPTGAGSKEFARIPTYWFADTTESSAAIC